tara:strand:+ start:1400 stop:1990 length:591 start_codon:yes stop_codon:yes gene_type:complete
MVAGDPAGDRARRKRRRQQTDRAAAASGIQSTLNEEERLRQEGLSELRGREETLEEDAATAERDLGAAASRAAAGAYGRQTGRARGGGMLTALSGVEMQVDEKRRDLARQVATQRSQAAMDRIGFERSTMKTGEQKRQEAVDIRNEAERMYTANTTLGITSRSGLDNDIEGYIRDMGLSTEQARILRDEADRLRRG